MSKNSCFTAYLHSVKIYMVLDSQRTGPQDKGMHGVWGSMILGRFSAISHKLEHWFNEALLVMGQAAMTTHGKVTWTEDVDEIDYFVWCILIFG
jgi:hypothetical protein